MRNTPLGHVAQSLPSPRSALGAACDLRLTGRLHDSRSARLRHARAAWARRVYVPRLARWALSHVRRHYIGESPCPRRAASRLDDATLGSPARSDRALRCSTDACAASARRRSRSRAHASRCARMGRCGGHRCRLLAALAAAQLDEAEVRLFVGIVGSVRIHFVEQV